MKLRQLLSLRLIDRFRKLICPGYGRQFLLERMPEQAVCAEVGVWKGGFSTEILKRTNPSKLYLIDPWEFQPEFSDRMYGGSVAKSQKDMESIFEKVRNKFGSKKEVTIMRGKSNEVAVEIEDESLDWVYIDGNHFYDYVIRDLEKFYPKVKKGGYITGDDFGWGRKHDYPVKKAVNKFISNNKVQVEEVWNDQYILKKSTNS